MRVFVTGGAGYIGTKVIEKLLENNIKVRCWDNLTFGTSSLSNFLNNPNFELEKGDVREHKRITGHMFDCDACIHLAALVFQGGEDLNNKIMEVNYNSTRRITDICKNKGMKLIFTSTCSNYGQSNGFATEKSKLQGISPYAVSKIKAEKYISMNYPDATILRLSTGFGLSKKMRFDLIVNEMTRDAVMKKKITVYNPEAWRPGLHIDDISQAIYLALTNDISGIYNVGHESLNYQKKKLCEILQNTIPAIEVKTIKKGDPRDYKVSFDKIKNDLNFKSKRTIQYGTFEIMQAIEKGIIKNPYDRQYQNLEVYRNE